MLARVDPVSQIRWIGVQNVSGQTIPAFAAMRVTDVDTSTGLAKVSQPNQDNQEVIFASDVHIAAGQNGIGTRDMPAYALYETGDGVPVPGDTWGAGAGSWKLRKGKTGFIIHGGAISGRVKVATTAGTGSVSSGGGGGTMDSSLVYLTGTQSVGAGQEVILAWDAALFDTFSSWPGAGNARITSPNLAGSPAYSYQVGGQIAWGIDSNPLTPGLNQIVVSLKVLNPPLASYFFNNTDTLIDVNGLGISTSNGEDQVSGLAHTPAAVVSANPLSIELHVINNTSSSLTLVPGLNTGCALWMARAQASQ